MSIRFRSTVVERAKNVRGTLRTDVIVRCSRSCSHALTSDPERALSIDGPHRHREIGQSVPRSPSHGSVLTDTVRDAESGANYGMSARTMPPDSRQARELMLRGQAGR